MICLSLTYVPYTGMAIGISLISVLFNTLVCVIVYNVSYKRASEGLTRAKLNNAAYPGHKKEGSPLATSPVGHSKICDMLPRCGRLLTDRLWERRKKRQNKTNVVASTAPRAFQCRCITAVAAVAATVRLS